MDDTLESKKTKPNITLESMFQKKFKAMDESPALPIVTQHHDNDNDNDNDDKESSPSPSLAESQASDSDSDSDCSNAVGKDGQIVKNDQIVNRDDQLVLKTEFDACLAMVVNCLRFMLRQGWECCAPEKNRAWDPSNEGLFIELFKFLAAHNEGFRIALEEKALEYYQFTSLELQKNIIHACSKVTIKRIIQDIGDDFFGIVVDGFYDKWEDDNLCVYLRYVDKRGTAIERFLGIAQVSELSPVSCKAAIDSLLKEHSLSPSKIRGQSYNGASKLVCNNSTKIHGLKTLIMKENQSAYYLHHFSHRLHFTVMAVAERCSDTCWLFMKLPELLSLVKFACARDEMLQDVRAQEIREALGGCKLESRENLIQEYDIERPYDTCWEYDYYKVLLHVVTKFPMIVEVLVLVYETTSRMEFRSKASTLLYYLESFEFVFAAHLMINVFGYTDVLSRALQRRDGILGDVDLLVTVVKAQFQQMRSDHRWEMLVAKVTSFCKKNDIEVPDMSANHDAVQRRAFKPEFITNLDHFRAGVYFEVIDQQIEELNNQFDEVNMELLTCMACLNPTNCFSSFDKKKLIRLAEFYPDEFSDADLLALGYQLDLYILDMRKNDKFQNLKELSELSAKLVETRKHDVYVLVYMLLKLMLVLPVTTPSIERTFSAMDYVRYKFQNSVGDQLLNDSLTTFIESELFSEVLDDEIISCFKAMTTTEDK